MNAFQAGNMLLRLCAVLVLSTLLTTETQARSAEENRLLTTAFDEQGSTSNLQALEPSALQASGKRVERDGERLTIHLVGGGSKIFANAPSCKVDKAYSDCDTYSLIADVKSADIIMLFHGFYEGGAFDLIDGQTGHRIELDDMPLLSPSGQRVLVMHNSAWSNLTGIEIWRHAHGSFVKDWSGDPLKDKIGVEAYRLENWDSEKRIALSFTDNPSTQTIGHSAVYHFAMVLTGDKWVVSESPNSTATSP